MLSVAEFAGGGGTIPLRNCPRSILLFGIFQAIMLLLANRLEVGVAPWLAIQGSIKTTCLPRRVFSA